MEAPGLPLPMATIPVGVNLVVLLFLRMSRAISEDSAHVELLRHQDKLPAWNGLRTVADEQVSYCTRCGHELTGSNVFCTACGAPLHDAEGTEGSTPSSQMAPILDPMPPVLEADPPSLASKKLWLIAAVIIIIVGAAIGIALDTTGSKNGAPRRQSEGTGPGPSTTGTSTTTSVASSTNVCTSKQVAAWVAQGANPPAPGQTISYPSSGTLQWTCEVSPDETTTTQGGIAIPSNAVPSSNINVDTITLPPNSPIVTEDLADAISYFLSDSSDPAWGLYWLTPSPANVGTWPTVGGIAHEVGGQWQIVNGPYTNLGCGVPASVPGSVLQSLGVTPTRSC
jgi:hypothetical protein